MERAHFGRMPGMNLAYEFDIIGQLPGAPVTKVYQQMWIFAKKTMIQFCEGVKGDLNMYKWSYVGVITSF